MRAAVLSTAWLTATTVAFVAPVAQADTTRDFEAKVRPLLVTKCQQCHGEKIAEAGLRLDSRRGLLQGGDEGPVVVPGDVEKSRLIAAVRHSGGVDMPPTGRLTDDEIQTLETWVAVGAPWSGPGGDDGAAPSREEDMERRIAEARASHWAFRPPERHAAPEPPATWPADVCDAWQTAPVDRFIAAGLAAAGLQPSAPAEPRDLVRRLFFDLTGLPPPADVADAFCASPTEDAYRALVDRLLVSREHAEHWARKWLDLARYADTKGYAFDSESSLYPFAWTYRDWVVQALHADLPYDRFVTLQVAADQVTPPVRREDLAALGFLTVGRTFLGNTHDIIDDRIDLVTRGLMGLTASCARCHDHKYEPISTEDYYSLHGIFASCESPEELPVIGDSPSGPEAEAFANKLDELRKAVVDHEAAVHARSVRDVVAHAADYFLETARPAQRGADGRTPRLGDGYDLQQVVIDRLQRFTDSAGAADPILGPWAVLRGLPDDDIGPRLAELVTAWGASPDSATINRIVRDELASARPTTLRQLAEVYGRLVARVAPEWAGGAAAAPDEAGELAALRALVGVEGSPLVVPRANAMQLALRPESAEHRRRKQEITKYFATAPGGPPRAMALIDRERPVDSHVFLRGNPGKLGPKVERRLPQVLGGSAVDRNSSGRLDLARTIVDPSNPLTARVLVNWAWLHHFGRGLVDTPGDLGLRGEPPSHPELLDDLARRFIDEGRWSLRWLHREIVTTAAWRQASITAPDRVAHDPDNRLFGRANRRRLDWESWRDSLFVAAGTLDLTAAGGRGVDPLATSAMHKRSLYGSLDRQDVPGIMRVFDIANPDTSVHARSRTTVPQQSLAVLNSPLVIEAAKRVAARTARDAGQDSDGRIIATWRAVLSRSPTDAERSLARGWLVGIGDTTMPGGFGPYERLAQAVLATAEFQFID
jgi:hypothetical protein